MITKKLLKTRSGFGLMEALIASGIIVMLASTSVGLSSVVVRKTAAFNDQIVANNLAAEPIEAAHWLRDKNISDGDSATAWDSGIKCSNLALICGLDTTTNSSNLSFTDSPTTIPINGKNYIQKIDFPASTDPNAINIHVVVTDSTDTTTLAELSSVITNWKVAQ